MFRTTSEKLLFLLLIPSIILFEKLVCGAHGRKGRNRHSRDVREGSIRLIGGQSSSEGNVEIYHTGLWGSVCDDEWDLREALIVCKSLGFSNASKATQDSEFGRARRLIWMDNLYCDGHEKKLQDCKFDGWGNHDCTSKESAGVVCFVKNKTRNLTVAGTSKKPKKPLITYNTFSENAIRGKKSEIRIMGGRNDMEGRVDLKFNDTHWGVICGDGWSLLEANVVCQQLGLGFGQSAVQSSFFGGLSRDIVLQGVQCKGHENDLFECSHDMTQRKFCPGNGENIAGVICSAELPDLVPDEKEVERSAYLEDRQLLFLQCAIEENCVASAVFAMDRNEYGWHYEHRRLLRFTARIGNIGTTDFRPFLPKHTWQWHMCHLHYHSMEVFAHFDVIDMSGRKVAEGHKASFCLEDSNCLEGVEKKYNCANYGDQGISVGCTDTYLHNIDCQWVDITELNPGVYLFKMSINPDFKVAELNYDNNAVLCTFYYNAVSASLNNCTLTRP